MSLSPRKRKPPSKTISPKKPLKIKGLGFDHSMLESIKNPRKNPIYTP